MGDNRISRVVEKYRLNAITNVQSFGLGLGPIMAPECLREFIQRDPSGTCKYLEWMIFQAGGGQPAMETMTKLWHGTSETDPSSVRYQSRADFLAERNAGMDESAPEYLNALREWADREDAIFHESVVGDQDVADELGFGFYRHWPGRGNLYAKIAGAINFWHQSRSKLKALHEVELDIYAGWKFASYSQEKAVYRNFPSLISALSCVRMDAILRDVRFETVYEDGLVRVICPLTVGASIRFGSSKWCTANRTDFERSFSNDAPCWGHWTNFTKRGPLLYYTWKCWMPEWLHQMAIHLDGDKLRSPLPVRERAKFFDVQNSPAGIKYRDIQERILSEHLMGTTWDCTDPALRWGGRRPGIAAWGRPEYGDAIWAKFNETLEVVQKWSQTFDLSRVVVHYEDDLSSLVDKV